MSDQATEPVTHVEKLKRVRFSKHPDAHPIMVEWLEADELRQDVV